VKATFGGFVQGRQIYRLAFTSAIFFFKKAVDYEQRSFRFRFPRFKEPNLMP
jgi:hypothetical protein